MGSSAYQCLLVGRERADYLFGFIRESALHLTLEPCPDGGEQVLAQFAHFQRQDREAAKRREQGTDA